MLARLRLCNRALNRATMSTLSSYKRGSPCMASKSLVFEKTGEPEDVLQLKEGPVPTCGAGQVHVKWLKAPINPSDMNTVQGRYPISPSLPGVPGHEGVGIVEAVGEQVTNLKEGQYVVPMAPSLGTWQQNVVVDATKLHVVPAELPMDAAATLCVNPPSAYEMLEMVPLKEGDVVIQNGATSVVGQLVIQLARLKGVRTVNIIRDRPNWDEAVAELKALGADLVTTEEKAKEDLASSGFPEPVLGLNCVHGSSGVTIAKLLRNGGLHVTYGAMSLAPMPIPAPLLIFKDITFRGYWLSGRPKERRAALDRLASMFIDGSLQIPRTTAFPLAAYKEAFALVKTDRKGTKVVFDLTA